MLHINLTWNLGHTINICHIDSKAVPRGYARSLVCDHRYVGVDRKMLLNFPILFWSHKTQGLERITLIMYIFAISNIPAVATVPWWTSSAADALITKCVIRFLCAMAPETYMLSSNIWSSIAVITIHWPHYLTISLSIEWCLINEQEPLLMK